MKKPNRRFTRNPNVDAASLAKVQGGGFWDDALALVGLSMPSPDMGDRTASTGGYAERSASETEKTQPLPP